MHRGQNRVERFSNLRVLLGAIRLEMWQDIPSELLDNVENSVKEDNEKRAKFVRLAEGRVQSALSSIRKIGNLSNRRSYQFDETDIRKIIKALKDAVGELERKFDPTGAPGQKTFKL
jgi:hypothetical protein